MARMVERARGPEPMQDAARAAGAEVHHRGAT
jgi:hypothetical protein